jgi:hypothetical protein
MATKEGKKRIKRALKTFAQSVKAGNLKPFVDVKGGLGRLSTESLTAGSGLAPLTSTNLAISKELTRRSVASASPVAQSAKKKKSTKKAGGFR